jgi:hypothetical protein
MWCSLLLVSDIYNGWTLVSDLCYPQLPVHAWLATAAKLTLVGADGART